MQPFARFETGGIRLAVDEVAVRHGERALPPVSFTAEPGTVTLIEGRSGSGKSSLLAALRGAAGYDGAIRVDRAGDGVDRAGDGVEGTGDGVEGAGYGVRGAGDGVEGTSDGLRGAGGADPDPASWLAWAGQRPGLIRGTVAANVALGDRTPDVARVRAALADAAAADLDLEQELGVQGAGLSGGQAQRVAVARALYRLGSGARVLALDEPSSALDAATEEHLWRTIRRVADDGATVLLVSHRPTARAIADRVVRIGDSGPELPATAVGASAAQETGSTPAQVALSALPARPEEQKVRPERGDDPVAGASERESDPVPDLPTSAGGILRMAMPRARRFAPAVLAGIASAAAAVGLLLVSGWLIVTASLVDNLVPLSVAIVGVRFFAVTRAVARYLERLAGHDAALGRLADLRAAVVRRLTPLAPAGLGSTDRGAVLAALVDDVENLQNLPLRVVQPLLTGGVVAVVSIGVLALIAPTAALALAVCLVIAVVGAVVLGGVVGARAEGTLSRDRADLAGALVDEFTALDVLQAYGAEPAARQRIRAADDALRRTVTRAAAAQALSSAVVSLAAGAASIAALALAVPGQPGGAVDAPWFAVAVLLPMAVFDVFSAVPQAASAWRGVRASAERIHAVLPAAVPPEVRDDNGEGRIHDGAVRLRGVTATWPGASAPALQGLDLDVAPGERILVTGSSGAGKSTLAAVLVGFLRSEGSYRIGEQDAARTAGPELRRHVGLCEQDPMLFDEDIRQNLLFARETATDAELLAVLDRVGLGAWVRERGGLDARVGERGALVSGGQAQRIALARAVLRGFPVLVLDEPTAGVDPDASDALLRDLLGATEGQTVILVSHVAPPSGTVDRTVRLDAGRILPVAG
jgi:thiol reductant ABC exporter CydC subunit